MHRTEDATFDEERALVDVMRAHRRPRFSPGDRYAYSNLSYEEYLRREIFAPLGATAGEMNTTIADVGEFARGYQRKYSAMGVFTRLAVRREFGDAADGFWLV